MGARQRLNAAHVNGSLLIAVVVGVATGSWTVGLTALALLLASGCYTGDIRPSGRGR